jgi:hypothetical protein
MEAKDTPSKKYEVIAKYICDMHAEKSATATATPKPGCQSSADHCKKQSNLGTARSQRD